MGSFSTMHWVIVLVIVALVFGTRKIASVGTDLGSAIKGFKEGVREAEAPTATPAAPPAASPQAKELS